MSAPGTASRAQGVCDGFVEVAEEVGAEGAVEGVVVVVVVAEEETRRRCR
jgi:hypothetical protein